MTVQKLELGRVREFMQQERIWPRVSEDGCAAEDYEPVDHASVHYIGNEKTVVMLHPLGRYLWQAHIASLGATPDADGLDAIRWLRENTDARKLIAQVPAHNWHAAAYARRIGFVDEGKITGAFWWRGRPRNLILLGMNLWQ